MSRKWNRKELEEVIDGRLETVEEFLEEARGIDNEGVDSEIYKVLNAKKDTLEWVKEKMGEKVYV